MKFKELQGHLFFLSDSKVEVFLKKEVSFFLAFIFVFQVLVGYVSFIITLAISMHHQIGM